MQYYLFVCISMLLTAGTLCVSKLYQVKVGASRKAAAFYSFSGGVLSFLIFWVWSGFSLSIPAFSFWMAFGATACVQLYTFLGFLMMASGKYTVYITYLMTGGMVLPFIYGLLFLGESIRPLRVVGLIALAVFVILLNSRSTSDTEKVQLGPKWVYIVLSAAVFFLNGGVSIFNKVHQIGEETLRLSTIPFAALSALLATVITGAWYLIECIQEKKRNTVPTQDLTKKMIAFLPWKVLATAVGAVASYLQLTSASFVDASILFPMITGGTIVVSALVGRFIFGERQSMRELVLTILCFVATLLFVEF